MDPVLEQRLEKIRSSPKLQSQQEVSLSHTSCSRREEYALTTPRLQTRVVLSAVEDTLRDSKSEFTPTAYFAALLSLLDQFISADKQLVNKDVATSIVYLLDLVTPYVPAPLLRSKFSHILQKLATALTHKDSDAPLLRPSIGCLESLLVVQDTQAWALPASGISPRRAVAGLLNIAVDHRPKVRKRGLDALTNVLKSPPPSPNLDHPAADMCAETSLRTLIEGVEATKKHKKHSKDIHQHTPSLMHALQLVKTVASASGGWPSRKLDALCDALLSIARSSNEYLTMAAFEVFETMFAGMADEVSSAKLPHLMEILDQLQPSVSDAQLLPPWIAVVSRGYDVYSQVEPEETFEKLPAVFARISEFLSSPSHNIRLSASECLISLLVNCVPVQVILDPSIMDEKTLEKLAKSITNLLSVKYQGAWQEVFQVVAAAFENLRWRSNPILLPALKAIGDLRALDSFNGKKEADDVIGKAITAMGPDSVLEVLPLNMATNSSEQGRAWLLPILRVSVRNAKLGHFRSDLVPVSEKMFQKVMDHGDKEKTMEIKIYETVVHQIWSCLPGYCDLPIDLQDSFDQGFAELISNLLYQQVDLRTDICRSLQLLVESNKALLSFEEDDKTLPLFRVSKEDAQKNIQHLASFSSNILAVLFNVYTQTLPTYRGPVLQCIDAYLGIIPEQDLVETFSRVATMLESSLEETDKNATAKPSKERMPPMSHTLMDLVITIAAYLPRDSLATLFKIAFVVLQRDDSNLQKKAYKLIPRLAESDSGKLALQERSDDLQTLLLQTAANTQAAARRHRMGATLQLIRNLPSKDLYFIPAVLPEVVMCTKETNEKTRAEAFDMLVAMGEKIKAGGTIEQSRVPNMPADAPPAEANLTEYFTMVSAGLAGSVPHSISATILALTRILHEFHTELNRETITELVQTLNIFLKNPNKEIVRSALGFSKVCIISLDKDLMQPLLKELIPTFLMYSKEHKGHLQAKIKHIFERLIGKFGYPLVEKYTPADDHKLIAGIRKRKERAKKKKRAEQDDEDENMERSVSPEVQRKKGKFESEYDEAVYGSEDESDGSGSDVSDDEVLGRQRRGKGGKGKGETYIVEDEDEPLDLLDKKALGHISTSKPVKTRQPPQQKKKAKTDLDGKLVFDGDGNAETMDDGVDATADDSMDLESGINAYVAAIKGRDAGVRKGRAGKIKFSNKRASNDDGEDDGDAMEVDVEEARRALARGGLGGGKQRGGASFKGRGGGMKAARMQRRGLGSEKTRGARVVKSPKGRPFRRG
jgi:ribosomal RNA-processing protein 12